MEKEIICSNPSCFKGQIPDGTTARKDCGECQCRKGNHNFVECDEWEKTCLYCGKFE